MDNSAIRFYYNSFGKPMLKTRPDVHFNISHSGRWVTAAIGEHPVGVDIEKIQNIDLDHVVRILSEYERDDFNKLVDVEAKLHYFYDIWTLKESYVKALGNGLNDNLSSLSFHAFSDPPYLVNPTNIKCNFTRFKIDWEYKMSVCYMTEYSPIHFTYWQIDDIIS